MGLDVSKVLVGAPDQSTGGAVYDAPIGGGTKPTSAKDPLTGFTSSGYISDDGLEISPDRSTNGIPEWSGKTIRQILKEFTCEISWTELQWSKESLIHAFGEAAVQTDEHTTTLKISADMPEPRQWAFRLKDGKNMMLIYVPNGQVTKVDKLAFKSSEAIGLPVTLSCSPDETGASVYIFTNDGQVSTDVSHG